MRFLYVRPRVTCSRKILRASGHCFVATTTIVKMIYYIATFIAIVAAVNGKVYFKENFNDASWTDRWTVPSDWKPTVSISLPFQLDLVA